MTSEDKRRHFPKGFVWGVATAAYQIEGAWSDGGKGQSIWDAFTHAGGHVSDGSNGDVACDSYHKFEDDVILMKQLGVTSYRLSISWSRVIPDPLNGTVNPVGVAYYNRLIDTLLANGITPCVTLYHWDLPLVLEEEVGGWPKEQIIPYFVDYAETCFQAFGDRVTMWITFNEPMVFTSMGYVSGEHAPGRQDLAEVGPYACVHNVIRAHAQVYRMYQDKFQSDQNGHVGISLNSDWAEAPEPKRPEDVSAAELYLLFSLGILAHPIFVDGDYPPTLKERMAARAKGGHSRLPVFTEEEKAYVKGSADFFGLNYYTTRYVVEGAEDGKSHYRGDCKAEASTDPQWIRGQSEWLYSVPWGLRKLLSYIRGQYGSPRVYVTENGFSDSPGTVQDRARQTYLHQHLVAVHQALTEDGVDVLGYFCWTLMDNFEWAQGYTECFGLFHVDFRDPQRKRTAKESAKFFKEVTSTNSV
ncbi:cytosolic beta-glucosidase-like [Babylonia areolata]|uniref:cytosolic beta-glucosidase-like n=1 Tax=Babylonia areolata TaxID=304850 RepID=UPI003FCF893E